MKTTTELIQAARVALDDVPQRLTGNAALAAMRELLNTWDALALCPGCDGAAMMADLDQVVAHLLGVRRAVFAADDVALAAAVQKFAKTKVIAVDAYDLARSHKATTANDRDALQRLMHGSPIHGDRDRINALAGAIEKWGD